MPSQYHPDKHHRRSIRLKGYDYTAAGAYFITICTHQRECLFGVIEDGEMRLNLFGKMARSGWVNLPQHFRSVKLDQFVVMPNHIHGIIWLGGKDCRGEAFASTSFNSGINLGANASPLREDGTQPGSIGAIVQNFKSVSTRRINQIRKTAGIPIWQRNYHEHIIRGDRALQNIQEYIQHNSLSWQQDPLHPGHDIGKSLISLL
ncbi:transposase [Oculatella sp. LEGE 06141]|uniref:transposase n=1 Tax=Oculatella sp. LEGE 06141 TaxID=1828648 RepID=UPI00187FAC5F|nr:transposase [Oculatella sp. LEGE 06141]MBE9183098.1 transposase [Oculatella sp. LEGE 06141]